MVLRLILAWSCVMLALLGASRGEAQDRLTATLAWVRSEEARICLDERAIVRAVDERIGSTGWDAGAHADLLIEAYVRRTDEGFATTLEIRTADGSLLGSRAVVDASADCSRLGALASFAIALTIDPDGMFSVAVDVEDEPGDEPEVPHAAEAPLEPAEPVAADPTPAAPPVPTIAYHTRAEGLFALAVLPDPAIGLAVDSRVLLPRVPLVVSLRAELFLPQRIAFGDAPAVGASFRLGRASVAVCPGLLDLRPLQLAACIGVSLGTTLARGDGLDRNLDATTFELGAVARTELTIRVAPPLDASIDVAVVAPLIYHRFFVVDPGGEPRLLHETSPVGVVIGLGLGLALEE